MSSETPAAAATESETPVDETPDETPAAEEGDSTEESEEEEPSEDESSDEVDDDDEKETAYSDTTDTRKRIEAKYPGIFKEYPELRQALYQSAQFREVFPTVDAAREAEQKSLALDRISESIFSGDPSVLFESIASENPKALSEFVANILPTLADKSTPLYLRAVDFGIRHFLKSASDHGTKTGDKNLPLAARHLANYIFGSPDVPAISVGSSQPSAREKQLTDELRARDTKAYESFSSLVLDEGKASAMRIVAEAIDPKNALTPLVRKGLVNAAFDEVDEILSNDKDHNARMVRLWKAAKARGFSADSKPSILSAYLARVRQATAAIRKNYRSSKLVESSNGESRPLKKDLAGAGRSSSGTKVPKDPRKIDWNKTSDRDILDGNFKLKG